MVGRVAVQIFGDWTERVVIGVMRGAAGADSGMLGFASDIPILISSLHNWAFCKAGRPEGGGGLDYFRYLQCLAMYFFWATDRIGVSVPF